MSFFICRNVTVTVICALKRSGRRARRLLQRLGGDRDSAPNLSALVDALEGDEMEEEDEEARELEMKERVGIEIRRFYTYICNILSCCHLRSEITYLHIIGAMSYVYPSLLLQPRIIHRGGTSTLAVQFFTRQGFAFALVAVRRGRVRSARP